MSEVESGERHASWLELFFDLIIVVAVAQLAHILHPTPEHSIDGHRVLLFLGLYYAIWSVWTSFTLYANVAGPKTRQRAMLAAMFGIAVMAASVPEVTGAHGTAFAIAYVYCRLLATSTWGSTNTFFGGWPAAQNGAGLIPWVISIWAHHPPTRYWLWGIGIALDLAISFLRSGDSEEQLNRITKRFEEHRQREEARGRRRRPFTLPEPARLNEHHLAERLGLFVIIVLGEAVMQVVMATSEVEWTWALIVSALAGFGLLVGFWWLTLQYGASAAPVHDVKPRVTMPGHFAMTAGIAAIAAGLGALVAHPEGHLEEAVKWTLCGGTIVYFLTSGIIAKAAGARIGWVLAWSLPAVIGPAALGLSPLPGWGLVIGLLVVAGWQVWFPRITGVTGRPQAPAAP
ncbi:low temperature requirement protein A [Herbidospora mongoliensis]|uniref:low temperature requirement protein A n=1 Tax=Herbidospora mongoliensis TaxID=688067 RepID=UPI00082D1E00|nr:low temperature requirement protein A [Herbidospora mongoliensis]